MVSTPHSTGPGIDLAPISRLDRFCLVALATMYASPPLTMFIWALTHERALTAITIALTAVLLACSIGAATRVWRYFFLIQLPLSLVGLSFAAYTILFTIPPGDTVAQIMVGASWEEIRGFVGMAQGYWAAIAIVGWTVCYVGFSLKLPPHLPIFDARNKLPTRVLIFSMIAAAAYCITDSVQLIHGIALNPIVGGVLFLTNSIPQAKADLRGSSVRKIPYEAQGSSHEEVHILVIGESVRRESWSAFGYERKTTPFLDELKTEVILLRKAVADSNLTNWSVPIIMTGISPEEFALSRVRGNLIDLAKEGGYSTAWLANQDWSISKSIGVDPDLFVLPADPKANIFGRGMLDSVLLPGFEFAIHPGRPRFVTVHMMGAHWEYFRRYPPTFERFGSHAELQALSSGSLFLRGPAISSALVDAYDNATLYSDWFLKELIGRTKALRVPASLMFFPDHGEDLQKLDGTTGHGLPTYSRHAFEIPAFIWVNEAFRRTHPEMVAALTANAGKEIRSHNVFFTEAELMGIAWAGADAKRSFASKNFNPDSSMKVSAGGVLVTRH